jgi:hypothetical protein
MTQIQSVPDENDLAKNRNKFDKPSLILDNIKESKDEAAVDDIKTSIIIPPDGGWGWVVMFASFCCNLVVDGIVFSFGLFIDPIEKDFGVNKATVALVGSLLSGK